MCFACGSWRHWKWTEAMVKLVFMPWNVIINNWNWTNCQQILMWHTEGKLKIKCIQNLSSEGWTGLLIDVSCANYPVINEYDSYCVSYWVGQLSLSTWVAGEIPSLEAHPCGCLVGHARDSGEFPCSLANSSQSLFPHALLLWSGQLYSG